MRPLNLALSIIQNRTGKVPRPSWCTYLVCYRCNARCGMCDSWRLKPGTELSPSEVETVFGKIGRLDVVRLTGGEPFLRDDMLAVADSILKTSRPSIIHITTNGSFPDRVEGFARAFPRPRLLRFMVSLDGLAEEHDRNRGTDVTFEAAMETVTRLVNLRERLGLDVSVNHTIISPQSLEDHAGLVELLSVWKVDVHSVLAYSDSAMYGLKLRGTKAEHLIVPSGYPLHPALDGADVMGYVDRELEHAARFRSRTLRWGKEYYLRGLRSRLRGDDRPTPRPRCVALRSHIRLLPDGGVPVCQFNTERVGNLLTQSWDEVWHGESASQRRDWVDHCPGCWAECEVMPNAIFSGDILVNR